MPLKLWISREEEAEIPNFKSHEDARKYFKEKYGDTFQISDSFKIDDKQVYSYMYIVDKKKFNEMQDYMEKHNTRFINAGAPETKGFMESYQSILILKTADYVLPIKNNSRILFKVKTWKETLILKIHF